MLILLQDFVNLSHCSRCVATHEHDFTQTVTALIEIGRWDSTLIMTYAEFGRRPRENRSNGTDHGTANAHFLLGGRVKGGLYGPPPALSRLDGSGNLPFAVDFRDVYASVLERWLDTPNEGVLGRKFSVLPVI